MNSSAEGQAKELKAMTAMKAEGIRERAEKFSLASNQDSFIDDLVAFAESELRRLQPQGPPQICAVCRVATPGEPAQVKEKP